MNNTKSLPLDWRNIFLLALVHVASIVGLAIYLPLHGLSWSAALIGLVLTVVTIFSISAGYHRLFSHCTYEAHPAFRFFLVVFGAGAFQNTVLAWAADHRRHHGRTDSDLDPYDARRGFWHSHLGWVLREQDPEITPTPVRDLERDPLVIWQDRYYAWIGIASGIVLPTLLGLAFGDPFGGFIMGAAVRLLVSYHTTFSINSFAHWLGTRPYSDRSSARDSFLVALISMGEGYHNFHHTFPSDYRNGVRRHQFDPTKWILNALSALGLARNLRRASQASIVRARLRMDERELAGRVVSPAAQARLKQVRTAIDHAVDRFHALKSQYDSAKKNASAQARELLRRLRVELKAAQRELAAAYAAWRELLRSPELAH